jgi:pimeloyl-ACP methyl ester carboxylesterase
VSSIFFAAAPGAGASPPGQGDFAGSIEIGNDRSLYMDCMGRGSPTVILENGLRSRGDFWNVALDETTPRPLVQPGIAGFTRVCTYDRPGTTLGLDQFSRSTPVPMPRTAKDAVRDLRALVRAAELRGPFVLAGHSTGGLIVRLFAAKHPKQVAALVQVDALTEYLRRSLTHDQLVAFDRLNNGPIPGLDYPNLEQILFRRSFVQMRRAERARPPGRTPVSMITRRLRVILPDGLPAGLSTGVLNRAWRKAQARLAELTPRTRQRYAERSSHYVMFSQPALIIRQVRRLVRRLR